MLDLNCSSIYRICQIETSHEYIGSAKNTAKRWRAHKLQLRKQEHGNVALQRIFNKHGMCSLEFSILEQVSSVDDLINREQYWIDTLKPSLNICKTAGSRLGTLHSEEAKLRMSDTAKRRTPEMRIKIGASHRGVGHTEDTRQRIGNALRGRSKTPEAIAKTAAANRGRKKSPEEIAKRAKSYVMYDPLGNLVRITNLTAFCREHDLHTSNLLSVIRGRRLQHRGWRVVQIP